MAAHAHAADGIRNAVAGGVDSIEHGSFADTAALKLMAKKGTYLVPTLCSLTSFLRDDAAMAATRPHWRERLVSTGDAFLETMRQAHQLGVPFAMGSDAGTPGNHHGGNADETVDMVEEVGMSPAESLRASTLNPAILLRQEAHLGALQEGRFADILACAENPFTDITRAEAPEDGHEGRGQLSRRRWPPPPSDAAKSLNYNDNTVAAIQQLHGVGGFLL